jgi:hypothetical protein
MAASNSNSAVATKPPKHTSHSCGLKLTSSLLLTLEKSTSLYNRSQCAGCRIRNCCATLQLVQFGMISYLKQKRSAIDTLLFRHKKRARYSAGSTNLDRPSVPQPSPSSLRSALTSVSASISWSDLAQLASCSTSAVGALQSSLFSMALYHERSKQGIKSTLKAARSRHSDPQIRASQKHIACLSLRIALARWVPSMR